MHVARISGGFMVLPLSNMSGLKLPRRKRRVYQKVDSPFPVPIESITNKPASNQRWFYYTGLLKENCVLIQQQGDAIFLYKMGFFGKGILSKSKPEHEIFLGSYQGLRKKNLPPKERRFQQQRFQQVRKHRYERHLSWHKEFVLQAQKRAKIDGNNSSTSVIEDLAQSREILQEMECTDHVGTVRSNEEIGKVGSYLEGDAGCQTMADGEVGIDVSDAVTMATDANQEDFGVDRLPRNLVASNDQFDSVATDDVNKTSDDVIGTSNDVIDHETEDAVTPQTKNIRTDDVIKTSDDVIRTSDDVIGTSDDVKVHQTEDTVKPQTENARTCDVMEKKDSERTDCELGKGLDALVTMKTAEFGGGEALSCFSEDKDETGSTVDAEDQGFIRKDDPYKIHEHLQLKFEEAFFLSYGLGCLSVLDDNKKALDLTEMWQAFCARQTNFVANYIAYHYYRSKGWVPRDGVKYGAHFVLYKHGPPFYHGSYSIIVQMVTEGSWDTSDPLTWPAVSGMDRITETVAKEVMFCYVVRPANLSDDEMTSPRCIPRFRVQEILMRRWVSSRERDLKDQLPPLIS